MHHSLCNISFAFVHSDVWGLYKVPTIFEKNKCFLTLIDHHISVYLVCLLKEKLDAKQIFFKKNYIMV